MLLSPTIQSAAGIHAWGGFAGTVDLADLVDDLRERIKKIQGGDMQPVQAMLFGQAITLETIFTNLARRAAINAGEYINATDTYLRLALKAQAQCRATLEALAEIKNPRPVAFVKQANIANGPQQINNGVVAQASPARAEEMQDRPNELSGSTHELLQDTRTSCAAGVADPCVEAVGTLDRATVTRG